MTPPAIKRNGDALHFIGAADQRWRLHNAHLKRGRPHYVHLSDPRENSRYSVNAASEGFGPTVHDHRSANSSSVGCPHQTTHLHRIGVSRRLIDTTF